ncbi:cytochrome c3 family protein [Slackia piriformis]
MGEEEKRRFAAAPAAQEDALSETASNAREKRGRVRRKWPITVGCVAAVAALAAAGFFVWHEQPSFCNAICHVPMDNYVEGYYEDETLCANAHYREGTMCLQCHEPKIDEQIAEGIAWVKGDFEVDERGDIATVGVTADEKMCATPECHDMQDVMAETQDWGGEEGVNPHDSHQGTPIDCSNCHGVHKASNMYCNTCHDYETPQGWTDPV